MTILPIMQDVGWPCQSQASMAAHRQDRTCCSPQGILDWPLTAFVTHHSARRRFMAMCGTAMPTLCLAAATTSEPSDAALQDTADQRQSQEQDMAHREQEIDRLKVPLKATVQRL